MGKAIEMKVHTFSQEEDSLEINKEVDPADKANNSQSVAGNRSWKKFKGFCRYCGMQGHKASDCAIKKQRMNTANGNKGENMKNNCFNCGKPGHYSKNCLERKHNPMGRQQKLFVGYVGEDCVYMA
jgi:Zinc knuckle